MWSDAQAWFWIERLLSWALALQTVELIQIREALGERGVWRWSALRADFAGFPRFARASFDFLLRSPNFLYVLYARLALAVLLFAAPHALIAWLSLAVALLVAMRWRGTFNGGSDHMTVIVLSAVCVALTWRDHPGVVLAGLWYLTVQVTLSYFIAGWTKLKSKNWRTGRALGDFLLLSRYAIPPRARSLARRPRVLWGASWLVMGFECTFPLALLNERFCGAYLSVAVMFHLANFYFFGLNRFLFAWLAAYPALYYCSQYRF